jgi:hypothetical protein
MAAPAAAAESPVIIWHSHELKVERLTIDPYEVGPVAPYPLPPRGDVVLVLMNSAGGAAITDEEIALFYEAFMLTDGRGHSARAGHGFKGIQGYDLGLLIYMENGISDIAGLTLTVDLSDPEKPEDTGILWHGTTLEVIALTDDINTPADDGMPEAGYRVCLTLAAWDGTHFSAGFISAHAYEIVLADSDGREYAYSDVQYDENHPITGTTRFFSLIYSIDAGMPLEQLTPRVRLTPAMWADAGYRGMNTLPFNAFRPAYPALRTAAIALEDISQYRYDSDMAAKHPAAALDALDAELQSVRSALVVLFGDTAVISDDPDAASVLIGVSILYQPFKYTDPYGALTAYNCTLTLTAYDALTHEPVTSLTVSAQYGETITAAAGTQVMYQPVPDIGSAADGAADAFMRGLEMFWDACE